MTTSELLEMLRQGYDGDPWHGPSLMAVVQRVTAPEVAIAQPLPGRHSLWAIVLHVTGWTREVERRIGGRAPDMPPDGDWPAPPQEPSEAAWQQALAGLETAHRALEAAVASAPDSRWAEIVGTPRDPTLGTGYSYGVMVAGLAAHYAYHAGQMAMLAPSAPPPGARRTS